MVITFSCGPASLAQKVVAHIVGEEVREGSASVVIATGRGCCRWRLRHSDATTRPKFYNIIEDNVLLLGVLLLWMIVRLELILPSTSSSVRAEAVIITIILFRLCDFFFFITQADRGFATSRLCTIVTRMVLGACRNSFLFFVSDRIYLDSLKISE
jgi:hypothetical protein